MQLMQPFDATQVDPTQMTVGQMPVGKHPVVIRESTIKPTKDNTAGFLELTLEVIDGPSKGVTAPYRLNIYNNNEQAVRIAYQQMSAICHAIGVFQVQDSQQLHNHPFMVEVGLQRDAEAAQKGYTEVKKVFDINGNEPGKAPAAANQGGAVNQQAGNGGGWGGGQQQAPAQSQAPAAGATPSGWGQPGAGQQQAPQAGQQAAPAAGGWQGGGAQQGGGSPAPWGQRK